MIVGRVRGLVIISTDRLEQGGLLFQPRGLAVQALFNISRPSLDPPSQLSHRGAISMRRNLFESRSVSVLILGESGSDLRMWCGVGKGIGC